MTRGLLEGFTKGCLNERIVRILTLSSLYEIVKLNFILHMTRNFALRYIVLKSTYAIGTPNSQFGGASKEYAIR